MLFKLGAVASFLALLHLAKLLNEVEIDLTASELVPSISYQQWGVYFQYKKTPL